MSLSLTVGPLTADELGRAVAALAQAGIPANGTTPVGQGAQTIPPPPPRTAPAMPPMPTGMVVPPPPPSQPPAAEPVNVKLANVLKLMEAYSRAGHQVAGARKVLGVLGLQRAQDADDAQLDWLAAAFANTGWAP